MIYKTEDFLRSFEDLPSDVKALFYRQEFILKTNWLDGRLHAKRLKDLNGVYSFRITRRYRCLFYFSKRDIVLFEIGHRKDVYRN
jgi:mRNA-degrading endonuclease RelE of RelBE toxin-antitoxin system